MNLELQQKIFTILFLTLGGAGFCILSCFWLKTFGHGPQKMI